MPELDFWNDPTSEGNFCVHLRGYSMTASDSVLWLSMRALDFNSIKRGIALIAALGMLAPLNLLTEIIDYRQQLDQRSGRQIPSSVARLLQR